MNSDGQLCAACFPSLLLLCIETVTILSICKELYLCHQKATGKLVWHWYGFVSFALIDVPLGQEAKKSANHAVVLNCCWSASGSSPGRWRAPGDADYAHCSAKTKPKCRSQRFSVIISTHFI